MASMGGCFQVEGFCGLSLSSAGSYLRLAIDIGIDTQLQERSPELCTTLNLTPPPLHQLDDQFSLG